LSADEQPDSHLDDILSLDEHDYHEQYDDYGNQEGFDHSAQGEDFTDDQLPGCMLHPLPKSLIVNTDPPLSERV
jgi:hypothetical protein